ncbi:hypothetical protein [Flavobacterium croceum]|uniref:hypothetical protein n=1 Tax=Flavobacterium croceum TaxID=370975 RepID=UPI0024A88693|nr:hypothetical protein [Flavobacterium croceum]
MDCCVNNLGRYPHNKEIDTYLVATEAGEHTLYLTDAKGNTFELIKDVETGETIKIAIGELNENMVYNFTIDKPSGTKISVNDCETFQLKTIINTQINGCTNPCETTSGGSYS